jgi:pyruvate,water dikinase
MGRLIVGLKSRKALRESVSGAKGSSLACLARAGFRVPPGFVITAGVFRGALTAAVRRIATETGPQDLENLEAVRQAFLSWDIIPSHRRAILRSYHRLGGAVAVRSSLIGADSNAPPADGQPETFLNVSGDEAVLAAVKKCLASTFGLRLWAYLYHKDWLPEDRMSMAVLVHAMVKAVVSGAALSFIPPTGQPSLLIEAVPGSDGRPGPGGAQPDRYTVGSSGELSNIMAARAGLPLLDEARIRELAAAARTIARKLGGPQDIDWAFDGQEFFILQAKPILSRDS